MQHSRNTHLDRRQFVRRSAGVVACAWPALSARDTRAAPRVLRAGYIDDPRRRTVANREGRNYWNAYMPEILSELGLGAAAVSLDALADRERLARYATLLLSDLDVAKVSPTAAGTLDEWVRAGGVLIALGTLGLDELCGNRAVGRIAQPVDEFTCAATFRLADHALTTGIHSYLQPQQPLLIFSDVRKLRAEHSVELARLYDSDGQDTGCAAVTARELGTGRVFYFSFSVPQTMWVLHQGRPVDRDRDGDGWWRRSDAIVRRPHSPDVAYADEILFLLQNLIGTQPHAFIDQLPPLVGSPVSGGHRAAGRIPDALFYWGGDDEGDTEGIQLTSSNWMKAKGLPYHINAMPRRDGTFGLSVDDAQQIQANGHELSLHYNFIDNFKQGAGFTRADVLAQATAFRQRFNVEQVCTVMHWTRWTGWAEPAKWLLAAGGKADNSFPGVGSPPSNNVNTCGFSFGTAFPFWFYDDWRGGNAKIDILEEPRNAYECGYVGQRTDFAMVHKAVDIGLCYRLTMNMYYHPIYIAKYPACRAAIEEVLRYLQERKAQVAHLGSNALYRWWKARSQAKAGAVTVDGDSLSLEVETDYPDGVVVKIPLGKRRLRSAAINRTRADAGRAKSLHIFGQNWALVASPGGKSTLHVSVV
jgi:hypothetical protein